MAYGLFRQLFWTGGSISLHIPIPTRRSQHISGVNFVFPWTIIDILHFFQSTISRNACHDEIFNVTVSFSFC